MLDYAIIAMGRQAGQYNPGLIDGLLGQLFKFIHNTVEGMNISTESISAYAITLIIMGIIYKLITIPFTLQNAKNAAKQKALQPEIEKIQQKYGYDQQVMQQKMMEFQKEHKMMQGMGSGCLVFILQMVIILNLYKVINNSDYFLGAESFAQMAKQFFWVPDLSQPDPLLILPIINSVSQLGYQFLNRNTMQANPQASSMMTMMYIMPIMFFFIFKGLAAGLVLYWSVGNVIEIIVRGAAKLFGLFKKEDIRREELK